MVKIRYIKADPLANLMVAYTAIRDGHVRTTPADLKALSEATGIPIFTHSEVYREMANSGSNEEKTEGKTFRERRAEAMANYQRIKEDQAKKPKKTTDDIVSDGSDSLWGFLDEYVFTEETATDECWVIRNEAGEELGRISSGESVTFEKAGIYSVGPEKGTADSGSGYGRMSESGRIYVDSEGEVRVHGRDRQNATDDIRMFVSDDDRADGESLLDGVGYLDRSTGRYTVNPRVEQLEREPKESEFWQRAKEAATKADGKCLYSFGVHIDPSTGEPHKNDHICNHMCHLLAKKARLERNLATAQSLEDAARRDLVNAERTRVNQKRKLDIILDELRKHG